MSQPRQLIERYEAALSAGAAAAPEAERQLYALHLQELHHLAKLLSVQVPPEAITSYLSRERRAFGWSFLSGPLGEQAEASFLALAIALEKLCV